METLMQILYNACFAIGSCGSVSYLSSTPNKTLNHKLINTITQKTLYIRLFCVIVFMCFIVCC